MRFEDRINNEYFEWMFDLVCRDKHSKDFSYRKLLMHLHNRPFVYSIPKDKNRAADGVDLRYRFALFKGYGDLSAYLTGPCSVLEMMVALAIRCEENIMDDTNFGDRTAQWFWEMAVNLGLGPMLDGQYDRDFVDNCLTRFMNREYSPDGEGGLFRIRNTSCDLRTVEIWYQLCWYLDNINL